MPCTFTAILKDPVQEVNTTLTPSTSTTPYTYQIVLEGITSTVPTRTIYDINTTTFWIVNQLGGEAYKIKTISSINESTSSISCIVEDVNLLNLKMSNYGYNIPRVGPCIIFQVIGNMPILYPIQDMTSSFSNQMLTECMSRINYDNMNNLIQYKGAIGNTGPSGIPGVNGATGPIEEIGVSPPGNTGINGINGVTGPAGHTGIRGNTGSRGIIGNTGPGINTILCGDFLSIRDIETIGINKRVALDFTPFNYSTSDTINMNNNNLGSQTKLFSNIASINLYANSITHSTLETGSDKYNTVTSPTLNTKNRSYYKDLNTYVYSNNLISPIICNADVLQIRNPDTNFYYANNKINQLNITTSSTGSYGYVTNNKGGTGGVDVIIGVTGENGVTGSITIDGYTIIGKGNDWSITAKTLNVGALVLSPNGDAYNNIYLKDGPLLPAYKAATANLLMESKNITGIKDIYANIIHLPKNLTGPGIIGGTQLALYDTDMTGTASTTFINTTNITATLLNYVGVTGTYNGSVKGLVSGNIPVITQTNLNTIFNTMTSTVTTSFTMFPRLLSRINETTDMERTTIIPLIKKYLAMGTYKLSLTFRFYMPKKDPGLCMYPVITQGNTNGYYTLYHGLTYNMYTPYIPFIYKEPGASLFTVVGTINTMLINNNSIVSSTKVNSALAVSHRPKYAFSGITGYSYNPIMFDLSLNSHQYNWGDSNQENSNPLRLYISGTTTNNPIYLVNNPSSGITGIKWMYYHTLEPITIL